MMHASMAYLRQFVPDVLAAVRFASGPGIDDLLQAVTILAGLYATRARKVPDGAPGGYPLGRLPGEGRERRRRHRLGAIAGSCGVPYDVLAWTAEWYFRGETLEAANAAIVNYHHRLPMTRAFGTGTLSSSDGQRFPVKGESLTARHLSRSPARPCTGPSSEPRLQTRPGNQP